MKIINVEPVALTGPYDDAGTPLDALSGGVRNCVWARIETDAGIIGWGEAYSGCYATEVTIAAIKRLARSVIGGDALEPIATLQHMRFWNRYWAMRGIGAQSTSAIEAALWDIVGQVKGQPVWQLLGDGQPRPVLLYASNGGNARSPQEIFDDASSWVAQGYRAYKMRCGEDPNDPIDPNRLRVDTERVEAAREALGPERLLFVDAGVPQHPVTWANGKAEAYLKAFHPYNVRFFEEPALTYDLQRYRELQSLNLIPIAGGESFTCPEEFEPFFEAGAYGVAQPDAAVVGGPASCVEVCKRAREFGISVCLHTWCAGVGIAQNFHAACSVDGVLAMEGPQMIHAPATVPLQNIWQFEDGYLQPPTAPGLGVVITDEFLSQYAYQPDSERYY
jgi:L-alanine-DL-glutamate epimerase-like enolase superfamily enzyme